MLAAEEARAAAAAASIDIPLVKEPEPVTETNRTVQDLSVSNKDSLDENVAKGTKEAAVREAKGTSATPPKTGKRSEKKTAAVTSSSKTGIYLRKSFNLV